MILFRFKIWYPFKIHKMYRGLHIKYASVLLYMIKKVKDFFLGRKESWVYIVK